MWNENSTAMPEGNSNSVHRQTSAQEQQARRQQQQRAPTNIGARTSSPKATATARTDKHRRKNSKPEGNSNSAHRQTSAQEQQARRQQQQRAPTNIGTNSRGGGTARATKKIKGYTQQNDLSSKRTATCHRGTTAMNSNDSHVARERTNERLT
eukprot:TRINITY_DN558_c0_g1_i4.p2 TRINITY_DN558_c0_g1~~TRINITY_DN558_c0_g1_i4.p2  ORF type:complete len:153 (+),score=0.60 TRINITY_DN558_c0_g1_i4:483-941(+)